MVSNADLFLTSVSFLTLLLSHNISQPGHVINDATSFPGSLLFPPPGAGGQKRDPGNEVVKDVRLIPLDSTGKPR